MTNSNFVEAKATALLIKEIQENTFTFIKSNPNIKKLRQSAIINIISEEIDIQKSNNSMFAQRWPGPCEDTYEAAGDVCKSNYAFSLAVVGVSAFFSFGIGTAIGVAGSTIALANCLDNAFHAYDDCLGFHD